MITPPAYGSQSLPSDQKKSTLVAPRPSSPRQFFARIYGHLESNRTESDPKTKEDDRDECKSISNTESSSDIDISDDKTELGNCYKDNGTSHVCYSLHNIGGNLRNEDSSSSATTALMQLAAGNVSPGTSGIHRIQNVPAVSGLPSAIPGLSSSIPGFLPPRPPFLFSPDGNFPAGFSAFLSRRRRGPGRSRRQRTTFSAAQTLRLEVEFRRAEYVGRPRRLELAAALRLSETQVKIWFQNRRAKDKRIEKAHLDHHYRTLAGLSPDYFFSPTSCALCLYKRESPCTHFFVARPQDGDSSSKAAKI